MKKCRCLLLSLIVICSGCGAPVQSGVSGAPQPAPAATASAADKDPYLTDEELTAKLSAITPPEQTLITSGDTRYYVSQTDYAQYPNASGSVSREDIDRLAADIQNSDGAALNDLLQPYGLSDARRGHLTVDATPDDETAYFESALVPYENGDVLAIDIKSGWQHFQNNSTHLLFSRYEEQYEFRGIIHTVHEQYHIENKAGAADEIIRFGDVLYYKCVDDITTGTGEIESLTSYCCLTRSEPILTYHDDHYRNGTGANGYGLITAITPTAFETLADNRISLTLELNLYDEPFEEAPILENHTAASYQLVLYNDGDGQGFYSYDKETLNFFREPESIAYIQETLLPRLELMAQSSSAELRRMAAAIIREPGF